MDQLQLSERGIDFAQKKLVPFLILMYVLAFLDRANIGFAKNAMQLSTGISEAAYALGAGIFFIGYAVFEVPSNIIMHHVGARRWMARIMFTWGLVAAGFAFVETEMQFLVLRFVLGVAEAGFFPGVVYYLSFWFPIHRRSTVMGLFYLGVPLSFVFGSPLSGILLELDGVFGHHGWQWMFAVEGLLATIVGIVAWFYLTDSPEKAHWIPEPERNALAAVMEAERKATPVVHRNIWSAMADSRIVFLCFIYFLIQISVYGLTFYLPTQVAALLGKKVGFTVGMVTAIPWIAAFFMNLWLPKISDRTGHRASMAAVLIFVAGLGILLSAFGNPALAIFGLSLAAGGFFSNQSIFWTMPTRILTGVQAASGIALINSVGNLGGFFAPSIRNWLVEVTGTQIAGLYFLAGSSILCALMYLIAWKHGMGARTTPILAKSK